MNLSGKLIGKMQARVPVQHYGMRSAADSYIETSLHDLNAEGMGGGGTGGGDDVDREGGDVTEDRMDNGEESTAVVSEVFDFQKFQIKNNLSCTVVSAFVMCKFEIISARSHLLKCCKHNAQLISSVSVYQLTK